ncbi:hypothetical protein [Microbacterium resistens]|uniref:hypothetical protein n=1 Tax=Microbacterium resistens TaxID=156977 RepID=UPI000A4C537F|nr:hypothetical protein [Microbacterium resistens]
MPAAPSNKDLLIERHSNDIDDLYELLAAVDKRLEAHDARFDGIDTRLDGIDTRLDGMTAQLSEVIAILRTPSGNA